jgi:hypothetical protein
MLHIWLGNCNAATYDSDAAFDYYQEPEWFTDPFVKEMVKDVDKTELIGQKLAYDYMGDPMNPNDLSSGVKCLIVMYKVDNIIMDGNSMGNNCAKWIIEIGKAKDCYMTLVYFMAFNRYLDSEDSEFICNVLNRKRVVKTFREYNKLYTEIYANSCEQLEYWENPDIEFEVLQEFDWSDNYKSWGLLK